ncbi:PAS domain-containing protein [Bradyrhizobium lablabi]|uniref:PAS domain-containing protein n=1 Tax=Bradyrhizobium lablabi TaxID=722472 RepID=UPI001BA8418F|nr:PAS domain-containing protein [Bradyrhizobium lablabi]MBR0698065.1 PAS domain-containing protein [Bradyrhizobium lablabi]
MNDSEFQLQALGDPRLADHATSALPAWLWSADGARILWANPVGAQVFGGVNGADLASRMFGPADPHRRQVARLVRSLAASGAVRLERLRGFDAAPGMLATCACARFDLPDGSHGVLLATVGATGRTMPFVERLQRLVQGIDHPVAAFARDGLFIGANEAARSLLGLHDLAEAGLDAARSDALKQGSAATSVGIGGVTLQRVGRGADIGLVAVIRPAATRPMNAWIAPAAAPECTVPEPVAQPAAEPKAASMVEQPIVNYEAPELTDEAPAEFALFDALDPPEAEPFQSQPAAAEPVVEADQAKASSHEPSPYIEPVAGEPVSSAPGDTSEHAPPPNAAADTPAHAAAPPSWLDEPLPSARRYPLRFMWQMDHEGRFSLGSDEFTRLIGTRTAAGFGRLWTDIAQTFGVDPEGRVMKASATRDTWSGIVLEWPVDGGGSLPVELSGLPIFDRGGNFAGYRGFGVCRDLDGLARLTALRRYEFFGGPPAPPSGDDTPRPAEPPQTGAAKPPPSELIEATASETPHQADLETAVDPTHETREDMGEETPQNVVPFRPAGDAKPPSLTPVENNAFNELARQLSARLEQVAQLATTSGQSDPTETVAEQPVASEPPPEEPPAERTAQWLAEPAPPPRGETRRDRALLDLLPVGVLIYRLDRLLYANRTFLERMGYDSLHALEDAGGLDALYVEAGMSNAGGVSGAGTPVTISASQSADGAMQSIAADARLHSISWDSESALALIFSRTRAEDAAIAAALSEPDARTDRAPAAEPALSAPEPAAGHADAEELGAILDTAAEGIVMFDAEGNIRSCNRSAEALFGYDGDEFIRRNLADLFALESQHDVSEYLAGLKSAGVASLLDHGREVLGRVRQGGIIPLSLTMGRTRADRPNFFAVFRDLSQAKKSESELREARRLAERAANARSDMLARISHELRTPLNAIIGFAEVMIGERFGALGNERYLEYTRDIRASGERVIAIVNDLLDLARIETGKLDLAFTSQNLNEMVESCVAVMQPQANRERIIIRTSLAHTLPPVVADTRALRQITLNLIGNSIHLANAGGQVIVSTALSDFGEVMLRVRDTGVGLNDNEVAAALEPFRAPTPSDQAGSGGVSLSLTKALVEANRAKFQIRTGGRTGTLIEVVFTRAAARA